MPKVYITYPGDATKIETFGGSPYCFLNGLRGAGVDAVGVVAIPPTERKRARYCWNLKEIMLGRGLGGYQYSAAYLKTISDKLPQSDGVVINMFQMYNPDYFRSASVKKLFYIDQTLEQLFQFYPDSNHLSSLHKAAAIEEERWQYVNSPKIFCKQGWVARNLIDSYGVDERRVKVILPGANISKEYVSMIYESSSNVDDISDNRKLKLVFVGKDWKRKGLDRLLQAVRLIPNFNDKFEINVIGPNKNNLVETYKDITCVNWIGFVDKQRDLPCFIKILMGSDVGVLLSTAEAGGSSLREFQLCGLAVMAPAVGGSCDMVMPGSGVMIGASETSEDIARVLEQLQQDRNILEAMKSAALNGREKLTWAQTAVEFINELNNFQ